HRCQRPNHRPSAGGWCGLFLLGRSPNATPEYYGNRRRGVRKPRQGQGRRQKQMAHLQGVEPRTSRFVVWRSIQLSYRCAKEGENKQASLRKCKREFHRKSSLAKRGVSSRPCVGCHLPPGAALPPKEGGKSSAIRSAWPRQPSLGAEQGEGSFHDVGSMWVSALLVGARASDGSWRGSS